MIPRMKGNQNAKRRPKVAARVSVALSAAEYRDLKLLAKVTGQSHSTVLRTYITRQATNARKHGITKKNSLGPFLEKERKKPGFLPFLQ